jgi:hypothetical protein
MKATATSEFHGNLSVTFTGLKEGINIRKLRGPRSNYCLDCSSSNSHVCGCGFPLSRTRWELPEDVYLLRHAEECGPNGENYGRGYICIELIKGSYE